MTRYVGVGDAVSLESVVVGLAAAVEDGALEVIGVVGAAGVGAGDVAGEHPAARAARASGMAERGFKRMRPSCQGQGPSPVH